MYRIFETDGFQDDLSRDIQGRREKIRRKLAQYVYLHLKNSPHYGPKIKKLRGFSPPVWRYRIGNYRFFYQIDDEKKIIFMTAAEHRGRSLRR